jgi:hypothetical protein
MPSLTIQEIYQFSKFKTINFVETGTLLGETIENVSAYFENIFTIELSPHYARCARERFHSQSHIRVIEGDSSKMIGPLCETLNTPTFFWLDGHYSSGDTAQGEKDCPLLEEIQEIVVKCKPACIIAIDDVRLFNKKAGEDWTGITREAILQLVQSRLESVSYFPSVHFIEDRMILHLHATS